jgi:hypothetical protein
MGTRCSYALFAAVVLILTVVQPALSQNARHTGTVTTAAPIFLTPDASRIPLRVAKEGTTLYLLASEGEWTHVEFNDPEFGRRVGYIETRYIKPSVPTEPPMKPMDLSVTEPAPADPRAAAATVQTDTHRLQDSAARAATEAASEQEPQYRNGKIPRKYKIWSGVLFGLGAYYFLSAAVVDTNDFTCILGSCVSNDTYRTTWLIMGAGLTAVGAAVLSRGIHRSHQSFPSVVFGPGRVVVRQTISLPRRR